MFEEDQKKQASILIRVLPKTRERLKELARKYDVKESQVARKCLQLGLDQVTEQEQAGQIPEISRAKKSKKH